MPTLDEQQRAWLDKALETRGRFTRAKPIRQAWEDYRRRRDKVVENSAGLPPDHPSKALIENGLRAADALAKEGKFAQAYKSLDAIKKMGANASVERARTISLSSIEMDLNVLKSRIGNVKSTVQFAFDFYEGVWDRIGKLTPCSAQPDLTAATRHLKVLADAEADLMVEMGVRENWMYRAAKDVRAANFAPALTSIERDIAVHVTAGHGDAVAGFAQRLRDLRQELTTQDNRYFNPDYVIPAIAERRGRFETAMRALRDISKFKGTVDTVEDDLTTQARSGLKPTLNRDGLEMDEKDRLSKMELAMSLAGIKDLQIDSKEKDPTVAPEPKVFDGDTMFGDLSDDVFGQGNDMPEAITVTQAERLIAGAKSKLIDAIRNLDPAGDEMFDLMVKSPAELAKLACLKLTGIPDPAQAGEAFQELFAQMAAEMRQAILDNSPNRMKDDKSEITVNGQTYTLVGTIGEGANGAIRRYTDGTKTFVVKSLKGGMSQEDNFDSMAQEMRTHKRLIDGAGEGSENIVDMKGAAVSSDGSLHMMLEEVEGGDMTTVGNNLVMLEDMGILPPEARRMLSLDLIAQTVKGMMAMQQSGLVHNDLKPQNMMIGRDGTVKIIDFGESRFIDDQTGTIPGAKDGGYNTTPGYEAPEHWTDDTVTGKVDSHALAGIMKIMLDPSMSETSVLRGQQPVGALGRIVSGLSERDPKLRPSLDSVLVSSLMDQLTGGANPEDVRDLQKAAAELNTAMRGLKATISAEDLQANAPSGKGMTDTMWVPYMEKGLKDGATVPVAAFQTMVTKLDDKIAEQRKILAGGPPENAQKAREEIAKAERQKKFWRAEIDRQMDAHRAEGKKELDDLIADTGNTVDVPGEGGGNMTLKAAVALRERNLSTIAQLQQDFYTLANDRPELAQTWLDETNVRLKALAAQATAIEKALTELAGQKARYFLAEQKLSEISARFGPRKQTGEEISDRVTPKEPPVPPPPIPEMEGIPEPPQMPRN